MVKYIVESREWFDKVNGNSYQSINVKDVKGNTLFSNGIEYGYGSFNEQIAIRELKKRDLIPKELSHDIKKELIYFSPKVEGKKRDLFDTEDYPENYKKFQFEIKQRENPLERQGYTSSQGFTRVVGHNRIVPSGTTSVKAHSRRLSGNDLR